ncbi:MAG TPA: PIG-L family deacetylase [Gemmatimonadales bacterium]|nr:PIG-L family deacetylase [Gemmatimonadales bacterium]
MRRAPRIWRRFGVVAAIAAIGSCDQPQQPQQPPVGRPQANVNAAGQAFPIEFIVIAHQDDWQLFQGDRVAAAVKTASKVVIVYVTAGDAGTATSLPAYWQARETASKASVDSMTAAGPWSCANATHNAHVMLRCTKANTVSYYMRLPDGNGEGQGFNSRGSLAKLRAGTISSFKAVDNSSTYTSWSDLVTTFQALVASEASGQADPNLAFSQHDWDLEYNDGDHSDHINTGWLVKTASATHSWNKFWYVGYNSLWLPVNVSGAQLALKWKLIVAYDDVMQDLMGETIIGTSHAEEWSERSASRSELSPLPPPPPGIPFAPTALGATPVSATTINLTWTDNSNDEDGFHLERAPDAGGVAGTYAEIATVGANVATYSDADVTADTRYWYRVRAFTAVGNSSYSLAVSASTSPPAAPSALGATVVNSSQINLAWTDNAPDEQGFSIERADDAGGIAGTYAEIATVAAGVVTYSNTGLAGGTRYWYRVRAYNALGSSGASNEVSAATPAPPAAPTALLATPFSTTQINLNWTDNATDE